MILAILGSLGGVAAFIGGATILFRGIIRNVDATKTNTTALNKLSEKLEKMDDRISVNSAEIKSLNDWRDTESRRRR